MGSNSDPEVRKISVWVCREEKLVLGLSKRNTCADVVKVLLEEQGAQTGHSTAESYCIVEKWRGFERILPNKTKLLKLWLAWGDEQKNVKFLLVKTDASLENRRARSAEARVVPSKQSSCVSKGSPRSNMACISPEKQRRVVRKAFRKLEKINRKRTRAAHKDASSAEKMETLVHLVVSQDHTIRQQVQRITELDSEIERREAKVHLDRIKRHGVNYVQDTYLVGAVYVPAQEVTGLHSKETFAKLEEYARQCEEVLKLQEELSEQEVLIDTITTHIQEELNLRWMQRRKEELRTKRSSSLSSSSSQADSAPQSAQFMEEERIKTQLDASLYIGLRLNADLEAIKGDLELSQQIGAAREKEMRDLLDKVNSMDMEEEDADEKTRHGTDDKETMTDTLGGESEWVEQARGLSKTENVNDDDSDTGLSSLHSQDSDGLPVWESLV
ncbi:ras association domain-containing protein 10 [Poeciliopsis prolifica]|uniref:ras association domain-containing protein 10 n=1 Tax=Poeciliopsis prolifica TaxID=188132 RepID=UPI0024133DE7|nr:ras association domain-containing protein 10 [Poeciliopsis prolifica]